MSDMLLCTVQTTVQRCSHKDFGRRFGAAETPWRAAFLAYGLGKPIQFVHEGEDFFVAPFDEQLIGHEAKAIGSYSLREAGISFRHNAGPPLIAPSLPAPNRDDSLAVYRIELTLTLPTYCNVVAHGSLEAHAILQHSFNRLRDQIIGNTQASVDDLMRSKHLVVGDVEVVSVEPDPVCEPEDYPRLF